jgi:hypothetical protein
MPTVMFQEHVGDYRAWLRLRWQCGPACRIRCTGSRVYRNADNENDLLILSDFADEARARIASSIAQLSSATHWPPTADTK